MSRDMSGAAPGKKTTDVHGVAALLRTLLAEGQDEQVIELVVGLLSQLVEKNTELELRLRKALRQRFGRQSEKLSAEQLSLFLEQLGQQNAGAQERRRPGRGRRRRGGLHAALQATPQGIAKEGAQGARAPPAALQPAARAARPPAPARGAAVRGMRAGQDVLWPGEE
ncbi:hypothetical protein F0U60_42775 [Archangium minus]|uniref:Transposase TnpC homeodomain domain-containing protein n=1 Tax=Archangium minus TaxID=83450 RepID=A0ABY9X400_9BACT|nr:hypothetical protein F0U60_42775 [Archangium minus]